MVNENTKTCQVLLKLKLVRKSSAKRAEAPDMNSAKTVTNVKRIETTLSNRFVFFSIFIFNGQLSRDLKFFGERQRARTATSGGAR